MTETIKEKKPRRSRRNFAKEFERLTLYLETIIRVKTQVEPDEIPSERVRGQLQAYTDIQDYIKPNGQKS